MVTTIVIIIIVLVILNLGVKSLKRMMIGMKEVYGGLGYANGCPRASAQFLNGLTSQIRGEAPPSANI